MTFHERFPGFASEAECARMHWRAFIIDPLAATTWFHDDRTRAGLVAVIEGAIIQKMRACSASIRETVGSEIEKARGE